MCVCPGGSNRHATAASEYLCLPVFEFMFELFVSKKWSVSFFSCFCFETLLALFLKTISCPFDLATKQKMHQLSHSSKRG
eukprot:m.510211 g.510211  ORF g.510211 m.510211 type:complete len:80 (+) comp96208_c0_seq1:1218-1457(+)